MVAPVLDNANPANNALTKIPEAIMTQINFPEAAGPEDAMGNIDLYT